MSDAVRRAIRTFGQAVVGTFVLIAFPILNGILDAIKAGESYSFDVGVWKGIVIACVISGVIALVSYVQNALEDRSKVPAVLKAPASEGKNPVPNDGGTVA